MKGNRKHIRHDNHAIIDLTLRVIRIQQRSQHIASRLKLGLAEFGLFFSTVLPSQNQESQK